MLMTPLRIALSIRQPLYRELVRRSLQKRRDVEVIGEALEFVDCLSLIHQGQPHVWIHSWEEGPDLAAFLSHARSIRPQLAVAKVDTAGNAGSVQLPIDSLDDLVTLASFHREAGEPASSSR